MGQGGSSLGSPPSGLTDPLLAKVDPEGAASPRKDNVMKICRKKMVLLSALAILLVLPPPAPATGCPE